MIGCCHHICVTNFNLQVWRYAANVVMSSLKVSFQSFHFPEEEHKPDNQIILINTGKLEIVERKIVSIDILKKGALLFLTFQIIISQMVKPALLVVIGYKGITLIPDNFYDYYNYMLIRQKTQ